MNGGDEESKTVSTVQLDGQAGVTSRGRWTCKTVTSSSTSNVPSPRGGCSWTKVGSKFLLFGGADSCQQHFGDMHSFDLETRTWKEVSTAGNPPSPRSGHSALALGESLIVYGGMNGEDNVTFNDIFELQTGSMTWRKLSCSNAPPRNSHAAVLHENAMIIIGGASPEGLTVDVHTVDLSDLSNLSCRRMTCQPAQATAAPPSEGNDLLPMPREMHSACLWFLRTADRADPVVLVMGGRSSTGVHRDLFLLDIASWEWRRLKDAPVPRCAHSACFVGEEGIMAVFGGWDGRTTVADDLQLYAFVSGAWTTPYVSPRPAGRFAHSACASGANGVLVFGGVNPSENLADVVLLAGP